MQMDLTQLIEQINSLNGEGIKSACGSPPDYDQAQILHQKAVDLARGNQELNPDYLAFSVANVGYARRRRGDSRAEVLGLLESTLQSTISSMLIWAKAEESSRQKSYAGRARLLEEIGLVRRYAPDQEDVGKDLKVALSNLEEAVQLYDQAILNLTSSPEADTGAEIISLKQLQNRKLRSIGVASTIAAEISRVVPTDEITGYQKKAVQYAHDELSSRLSLGEESGFNLANAYHTLGVAQSELVSGQNEFYSPAKENFHQAEELSIASGDPMTVSVLSFREAWLEYKRDHSDSESIRPHLALVLEYQKSEKTYWNKAVRLAIRPQMQILATAVGGAEQSDIESWYK